MKWARAQDYNWTGISAHSTLGGKAKRSLLQFTPYSWDSFEWRAFSTPQRCLQAAGLLLVFLVMEVTSRARREPEQLVRPTRTSLAIAGAPTRLHLFLHVTAGAAKFSCVSTESTARVGTPC